MCLFTILIAKSIAKSIKRLINLTIASEVDPPNFCGYRSHDFLLRSLLLSQPQPQPLLQ